MGNTKRKPTRSKSISGHPLFPAVVALWFGALFGLGSLAIRPALIEALVLKIGLDLVVPATAPPLGVTARIVIALIMASLGAAIGAALALRLARSRIAVRERKRTAANPGADAEAEAALWSNRNVYTDGPLVRPILADEEPGEAFNGAGLLAQRRRAEGGQPGEPQSELPDPAALPNDDPQIFDISATWLAPVAGSEPLTDTRAPDAPLDLGAFLAPESVEPQPLLDLSSTPPVDAMPAPLAERDAWAATEAESATAAPDAGGRTSPPEAQPALADLGMTELARRLQESVARRRAARAKMAALPNTEAEPEMPTEEVFGMDLQREDFLCVAEPEDPPAAVEPVVIFPGQIAQLRPLDISTAAVPDNPGAPARAVPAVDPGEAERALRLALANLQRISGAA